MLSNRAAVKSTEYFCAGEILIVPFLGTQSEIFPSVILTTIKVEWL